MFSATHVQRDGGGVGRQRKDDFHFCSRSAARSTFQLQKSNAQSFHLIGELRPTHLQRHFLIWGVEVLWGVQMVWTQRQKRLSAAKGPVKGLIVNKRVRNAVFGCNHKNDRMISAHFQGKPFSITVIQVYAPTSNAEEAEVEWFYEDLQDLLELTPKKMSFSSSVQFSRSVVSDSLWPHGLQPTRLLCPWDFPGKSTGVGCHCLLRIISSPWELIIEQS